MGAYYTTTLQYKVKSRFFCEKCGKLSDWVTKDKEIKQTATTGMFTNMNAVQARHQNIIAARFSQIRSEINEKLNDGKSVSFLGAGKCKSCRHIQSWSKHSIGRFWLLICGIIAGVLFIPKDFSEMFVREESAGMLTMGLLFLLPSLGYLLIYDIPARIRHKKYRKTLEKRNRPEIEFILPQKNPQNSLF